MPITPAIYRVRRRDGGYLPIEINGTLVPAGGTGDPDGGADPSRTDPGSVGEAADDEVSVVIIGRYSADRDLEDQIMARLLGGESATAVIELIPGFGRWRHQLDHYAVVFTDEDEPARGGRDGPGGRAGAPGDPRLRRGTAPPGTTSTARVEPEDMPEELARAAAAHGLTTCWVQPVDDPMRDEAAVILVWGRWVGRTSTCTATPSTPWSGPWPSCCVGATRSPACARRPGAIP